MSIVRHKHFETSSISNMSPVAIQKMSETEFAKCLLMPEI
jgi:hypothetical protein